MSRGPNQAKRRNQILRDLILAYPDKKKRVDIFALSIDGLVIFPKTLGHIDEAVLDLFDWLDKRVTPFPAIFVETFRSLNACRKAGEDEDVDWIAPWMIPDEILYRCEDFDWVPLLEIWRAVGYAPLLVLRQYRSRQFILATQGLV
ncbi:coiled-coil domain-containing protein 102A-like protein [Gossypium australe]|uniref:Coiled-coil domain-containing protein 102A-like protein n=1 Tax=Gossypium australe TaxID=47621 RepID=A0A5B6WKA5_9ROSI|nr:coiled-coil domain-containing protein 102A-like protein [Gossypium australe]